MYKKGPQYFYNDKLSIVDITMAPYFARMFLLKEIRDFSIPYTDEFYKWHHWKYNVLEHKNVN